MTERIALKGATYIAIADVQITRDTRQRRDIEIDSDGLADSVRHRGVLSPILLSRSGPEGAEITLVFGERRLTAAKAAQLTHVPAIFVEDLDSQTLQILELEENLKRQELPWKDEVRAIARIHELYCAASPGWTLEDTAKAVGYSEIGPAIRVAEALDIPGGETRIGGAGGMRAAWNVLQRHQQRAIADMMNDIGEAASAVVGSAIDLTSEAQETDALRGHNFNPGGISPQSGQSNAPTTPPPRPIPPESIICGEFYEWASAYSGPKFNFLHCDFPYGTNVWGGPLSGKGKWTTAEAEEGTPYNDDEDVYWKLCDEMLTHMERICADSAHMLFWLDASASTMERTIEFFRERDPSWVFLEKPLIWMKTDNVGIVSDPKRRARHIYEACLFASRGDRWIVKPISDAYGAPTDKQHHPSTKPEPVLRHFMQLIVDENTRMLDPTCGSGSALRAAESLGAKHVLGIERDKEWAAAATTALKTFRSLRSISR